MVDVTSARSAAGRPRDAELDRRIIDAALRTYAAGGWAGFTLDAVAKAAGCGRPALYRRWSSKKELLMAALTAFDQSLDVPDVGTARDQLVDLARRLLENYFGPAGMPRVRMLFDRIDDDAFQAAAEAIKRQRIEVMRGIVTRGVARGELAPDVSPSYLLNAVTGGMLSIAVNSPEGQRAELASRIAELAAGFVDFVLFDAPGRASATP